MHSPEQMKKKAEARADALHHHENSAVDGKHDDMKTNEMMYRSANKQYDRDLDEKKYNESVKNIPQKERDVYSDRMKSENGPL